MNSFTTSKRARILPLAFAFLCCLTAPALAQSNCPAADPNDNNPDDAALNACLSGGGTITVVHGSPGYILTQALSITVPGTTLIGDSALANFVARSDISGRMLQALNVGSVTLQNLWFDGNKGARSSCNHGDGTGTNLTVISDGLRIDNVGSINALCGSAAEVQGTGIEISNSYFAQNGYAYPTGPWSDGLTVWECTNGSIHNNDFADNTDVDLIVGGANGCSVYGNGITHYNTRGLAGIMVAWFGGLNGNHANSSYHDNTVSANQNLLSFGLMVGQHPWTLDPSQQVSDAGSVYSNSINGAVVNLAVDGTTGGSVSGNGYSGAQGSAGYPCTHSSNYAAAHFGGSIQPGYESFAFDAGYCGVP
jgi:hypothetical protein